MRCIQTCQNVTRKISSAILDFKLFYEFNCYHWLLDVPLPIPFHLNSFDALDLLWTVFRIFSTHWFGVLRHFYLLVIGKQLVVPAHGFCSDAVAIVQCVCCLKTKYIIDYTDSIKTNFQNVHNSLLKFRRILLLSLTSSLEMKNPNINFKFLRNTVTSANANLPTVHNV